MNVEVKVPPMKTGGAAGRTMYRAGVFGPNTTRVTLDIPANEHVTITTSRTDGDTEVTTTRVMTDLCDLAVLFEALSKATQD